MPEKIPSPEFSQQEEQNLIAKLREKGVDDPEVRKSLMVWCEKEEAEVASINTSRAGIELDLKKAKLYRAAGYRDEAWASLEAARQAAHNEGDEELFRQAEDLMDQMDAE